MKLLISLLLFSGCGGVATSLPKAFADVYWGYPNQPPLSREWVSPNGRMSQQSLVAYDSSALDMWPTAGPRPTRDSISEITFHRTGWSEPVERFNISAMASADNGAYRFGVEAPDGGVHRDMIFCFEQVFPDHSDCQLKITPGGVFVTDDWGKTWRKL